MRPRVASRLGLQALHTGPSAKNAQDRPARRLTACEHLHQHSCCRMEFLCVSVLSNRPLRPAISPCLLDFWKGRSARKRLKLDSYRAQCGQTAPLVEGGRRIGINKKLKFGSKELTSRKRRKAGRQQGRKRRRREGRKEGKEARKEGKEGRKETRREGRKEARQAKEKTER